MNFITRAKKMRVFDVCNILTLREDITVLDRSGNTIYKGAVSGIVDPVNNPQPKCAGYIVIGFDIRRHDIALTVIPTTDDSYTTVAEAINAISTHKPLRIVNPDDTPIYETKEPSMSDPTIWQYHNWPSMGIVPFVQTVGIAVSQHDPVKEDNSD